MNKIVDNIKKNRGSVTLYVLIAVLFILILIVSAYTISQNKKQSQEKEYSKIKQEYEKDINLEQEYVDITNKILIKLTYADSGEIYNNKTWTNKDIKANVLYPSLALNKKLYFITNNSQIQQQDSETEMNIISNGTVKAVANVDGKNKETKREIKYIDKVLPTCEDEENTISGKSITLKFKVKDENSGVKSVKIKVEGELRESFNYEFNEETYSGSKEEDVNYTITGLEENKIYSINYEIEDYAGNILNIEKTMETTNGDPVAQIIEINGVELTEEEKEKNKYATLGKTLDYCNDLGIGTYKIQMLRDTFEATNRIKKEQNITIDLSGKSIKSDSTVIYNYGDLTILDSGKEDSIPENGIISSKEEAIISYGKLTIGEKDNNEPFLSPKIETQGSMVNGIFVDSGEFNFYDGIIKGADGNQGYDVRDSNIKVDTPTYASVESYDADHPNWLVLRVQAQAVAKLGTVTYMTLQKAIDVASEGQYEKQEVELTYKEAAQKNGDYYFENNKNRLISNNTGIDNSVANSYIKLDLSDKEGNVTLKINAEISSQSGQDIGYATISTNKSAPAYTATGGNGIVRRMIYMSGTQTARDYTTTLTGGQIYYLHLGYRKNADTNTGNDQFIINNIILDNDDKSKEKGEIDVAKGNEESVIYLLGRLNSETGTESVQTITESVEINDKKNIVLDLKGNSLTSTNDNSYVISNYGKLKITDTYAGTKGSITSSTYNTIYNDSNATLTLEDGIIDISKAGNNTQYYYGIVNYGDTYVTGGTITASGDNAVGIGNMSFKTINSSGGTFKSTGNYYSKAIQNNLTGNIYLNNSSIICASSSGNAINNLGPGNIEVKDCNVLAQKVTNKLINIETNGIIKVIGGKISQDKNAGSTGIYINNSGNVELLNANMEILNGIYNYNNGKVSIEDSEINCTSSVMRDYAGNSNVVSIKNSKLASSGRNAIIISIGKADIDNIIVSSGILYFKGDGIYNINNSNFINVIIDMYNVGNINFYNNTIKNVNDCVEIYNASIVNFNGKNQITSTNSYGMAVNGSTAVVSIKDDIIQGMDYGIHNYSTGTINIGEKDGNINNESPLIIGNSQYGINNASTGNVNFYDGIIKGKIDSYYGGINETEDNTEIVFDNDGTYETATLGTNTKPVAKIGETTYLRLQDAIDACPTDGSETEIILLRNYKSYKTLTVEKEKNIILNLSNYTVQNKFLGSFVNSEGKLVIKDGTINGTVQEMIKNQGEKLRLENITLTITKNGVGVINEGTGTVELINNVITNSNAELSIVKNKGSGKIIAEGNTIKIFVYTRENSGAIENSAEGTIEYKSGTIINSGYRGYGDIGVGIKNKGSGTVNMTGGTIINKENYEYEYTYGISNEGEGTVNITGGTIKQEHKTYGSSCKTVYNKGKGIININNKEGELDGTVYNYSSGVINIENGTIKTIYNGMSAVDNYADGEINIKSGNITSSNYTTIYNERTGTINIIDGTIKCESASSYNTINNESTGTINIGEKGEPVSNKNPLIVSKNGYGIVQNTNVAGKISFYDGIVKGKINAKKGDVNEYEEGYDLIIEQGSGEDAGYEIMYLAQLPLVQVGEDETNTYKTLEEGIAACPEGEQTTIKLLRKASFTSTSISKEIPSNKDIIFDLNGNEIENGLNNTFINNGKFEINNGTIKGTDQVVVLNKGEKFRLENVTLTITGEGIGVVNEGDGTVELLNNTITNNNAGKSIIKNKSSGKIVAEGNTIKIFVNTKENSGAIENSAEGTIEYRSGTIINSGYTGYSYYGIGIKNIGSGTINMTGGIISNKENNNGYPYTYGISNEGEGIVNITGGSIQQESVGSYIASCRTVYNKETGIVNINNKDGSLNGSLYNYKSGVINIEEGTITATKYIAIENYANGEINIKNGNIVCSASEYDTITNGGAGTINITGGKVTNESSLSNRVAILNKSEGNINIGEKGKPVNIDNPVITSKNGYGIFQNSSVTGNINFYDGIVKGKINAKSADIKEIEEGYDLIIEQGTGEDAGYEIMYLAQLPLVQVGDDETNIYNTVEEGISACPEGEQTTIKLLRKASFMSSATSKEIPSNKDIIFDLNGKEIENGLNNAFINDGKFEIKNGTIKGTNKVVVLNRGEKLRLEYVTLTIEGEGIGVVNEGEGTVELKNNTMSNTRATQPIIQNKNVGTIKLEENNIKFYCGSLPILGAIENNVGGIIEYINGTIVNSGNAQYLHVSAGIRNIGEGTVNVTGGTITNIDSDGSRHEGTYGVSNEGTGIINISGATINQAEGGYERSYAVYNSGAGTVNIDNQTGIISGRIYNFGVGTINIENANISSSKGKTVVNRIEGVINIKNGKISTSYGNTICNEGTGTINITGGTISNSSNYDYYSAINNTNGTINITGGTITCDNGNAIYVNGGIITLGTNDSEYDDKTPIITGKLYGIYNNGSGKINFYDGTVRGEKGAIYGSVYTVEDNFKLLTQIVDGYEKATLTIIGTSERVCGIDNIYYITLQSAVNICPTNGTQKTIKLYKDVELTDSVLLESGKNVVISLNSFTITYNGTSITNANKSSAFNIQTGATLTITN